MVCDAHHMMHGRKWSEALANVNRAIAMLRGMELPQPRGDHALLMLREWFHGGLRKGMIDHLAGGWRRPGSLDLAVAHIYVHAAMTCLEGRSPLSISRPVPQPLAALIVLLRCRTWLADGLALREQDR